MVINHVLKIRGRSAEVEPRTLTQGTAGMDTLTLDLDTEWDGLNATVTFASSAAEVTPVLIDSSCEIPHEVLTEAGTVDIYVLGTRDGKVLRHAAIAHKMIVKAAHMSDGSTSADPTLSAYRDAYDKAVKATQDANSAAERVDAIDEQMKTWSAKEKEREDAEQTRAENEELRAQGESQRADDAKAAIERIDAAVEESNSTIAEQVEKAGTATGSANQAAKDAAKAADDANVARDACNEAVGRASEALGTGLHVKDGKVCQRFKRKVQ